MQADGKHDLDKSPNVTNDNRGDAGDPYPGTANNRSFTNTSNPDSGSYYIYGDSGVKVTNISNAGISMTADIQVVNPIAMDDNYSTDEDTLLTVVTPTLLSNDLDPNNRALSGVKVSDPSHGTVTLNSDGTFTYMPEENWNGSDSFTYKASNGVAYSSPATVTLTVNPVDDVPSAVDDAYATNEDVQLDVSTSVMANDIEVDGDALTAIKLTAPLHGELTFAPDGSFTYLPETNWYGTDSFTYKINDGTTDSSPATVSITVDPVNDPPVAIDDAFSTDEDTPLDINAPGLLINDSDIDTDLITVIPISSPSHGGLTIVSDGSISYRPADDWNGIDSFTYQASDGSSHSNTATVSITVNPVNDAPVAKGESYPTTEDVPLTVSAPGLLANDTDIDSQTLTAVADTDPIHGTLNLQADGSFTYTPNENYNGADSFTYKVNDGEADSSAVTVTVTMKAVNDAPIAGNDALEIDEDSLLTLSAPGILGNDSDAEGSKLTAIKVTNPAHGVLTLNSNGSLTYKPTANWNGADHFTYKAKDGVLSSKVATATITVNPVNDAPVAINDSFSMDQGSTLSVPAPAVLSNDRDIDGDILSAGQFTQPLHGVAAVDPAGAITYTPDPDFYGKDTFTYTATDGQQESAPAVVTITVNKLNLPPVVVEDSYTVNEDRGMTIYAPGILSNDSDPEGVRVRAILVTKPAHGNLSMRANGWFFYKPAKNWNGDDSFIYKVTDGVKVSEPATVHITVNAVNDAPVAIADVILAEINQDLVVLEPGVMANDIDVDGDALTAKLVRNPLYGTVTFEDNGSFTYKPKPYFLGIDTFKYRVSDGVLSSNVIVVTIKVKRPVYAFSGFLAPVDNKPTINLMTAGESVPVRFSLNGDRGTMILARGYPKSVKTSCSNTAPVSAIEETTTEPAGLVFNPENDEYTYVWLTNPSWAGTCRKFSMLLIDGKVYSAFFKFE